MLGHDPMNAVLNYPGVPSVFASTQPQKQAHDVAHTVKYGTRLWCGAQVEVLDPGAALTAWVVLRRGNELIRKFGPFSLTHGSEIEPQALPDLGPGDYTLSLEGMIEVNGVRNRLPRVEEFRFRVTR